MNIQNMTVAAKTEKVRKIKMSMVNDSTTRYWHFHDEYEMIYVSEGSAIFVINGKETIYEENSLIFIRNLDKHMVTPVKEPFVRYMTVIDPDFFEQFVADPMLCSIFKRRTANFSDGIRLTEDDSDFVLQNLKRGLADYEVADSYYESYCMTYVLKILIHLFRSNRAYFPDFLNKQYSQVIAPIQKFLDDNFNQQITLDELSAKFFINKYHLLRTFKETTGYSIKRYITLKRILKAKAMLYHTEDEISQIALKCGYNSNSNFIRAFKNTEGLTPLEFRKKSKGKEV